MSHRLTVRATLLVALAAGAVLVPSASAFATDSPKPTVPGTKQGETPHKVVPPSSKPAAPTKLQSNVGKITELPRGGVAAGEQPVRNGGASGALYGSAACAVLMAGVGTIVLRRRSATRNNG